MTNDPSLARYGAQPYRRCGRSGLKVPTLSLGLWHNFGDVDRYDNSRALILGAFDRGITHLALALANNYGQGGSRKYLLASLDASPRRLGLDDVDISYPHCPGADTPLGESMGALHERGP